MESIQTSGLDSNGVQTDIFKLKFSQLFLIYFNRFLLLLKRISSTFKRNPIIKWWFFNENKISIDDFVLTLYLTDDSLSLSLFHRCPLFVSYLREIFKFIKIIRKKKKLFLEKFTKKYIIDSLLYTIIAKKCIIGNTWKNGNLILDPHHFPLLII